MFCNNPSAPSSVPRPGVRTVDHNLAEICRLQPQVRRIWTSMAQVWSKLVRSGQVWPKFGRNRSSLAEVSPSSTESDQTWPISTNLGQTETNRTDRIWSKSVEVARVGPKSGKVRTHKLAEFGQNCPILVEHALNLTWVVKIGRNRATFGRCRARFPRSRHKFGRAPKNFRKTKYCATQSTRSSLKTTMSAKAMCKQCVCPADIGLFRSHPSCKQSECNERLCVAIWVGLLVRSASRPPSTGVSAAVPISPTCREIVQPTLRYSSSLKGVGFAC